MYKAEKIRRLLSTFKIKLNAIAKYLLFEKDVN